MSNSTASLNLSVDDLPNVLESLTAERTRRSTEARLKSDLPFFAEYALRIRTKKIGTPEPLVLNQAQLRLHSMLEEQRAKTGRVRALILKGRQMGVSTYVAARFYHRTINSPGIRTFIVAHSDDGSRNLYQIVRRFQDSMPEELKPSVGVSNATELIFDRIDSGYLVSVASTEGVGRSATAQNAHLSEMAFWKNLDDHFAGLLQTIPDVVGSEIIIESTAFGFNDNETENGNDQADSGRRVLQFMKNQYGPPGAVIELEWHEGLWLPALAKQADLVEVENMFIEFLRRAVAQNRRVSASKSPTYAPNRFAEQPEAKAKRISVKAFADAMERLFALGR